MFEKVFKDSGLSITVEVNKNIVEFLDVTIDIRDKSYKPYLKENNVTKYVNVKSNHPPVILKNLPKGINTRLSEISSSNELFMQNIKVHQDELKKSGFDYELKYDRKTEKNKHISNIGKK